MSDSAAPVWRFEHCVEAAASRQTAWEFWTDPANLMELEGDAVDSIELDGPFVAGANGVTVQGGTPTHWKVTHAEPGRAATIEVALDGAVFRTHWTFETISDRHTRLSQRTELVGDNAAAFLNFMALFEVNAPEGMAKLAKAIENAQD